jgi:hypothetical protein
VSLSPARPIRAIEPSRQSMIFTIGETGTTAAGPRRTAEFDHRVVEAPAAAAIMPASPGVVKIPAEIARSQRQKIRARYPLGGCSQKH